MPATVDNKGIHSGWSTDEDNWGALMNQNLRVISALVMSGFAQDLLATSGLTYGFRSGTGVNAGGLIPVAAGTLTLPPNATSYIVRTVAGVVSSQTSATFPDRIHLATVVTNVSNITSIVDERYVQDVTQNGTLTARALTSLSTVNARQYVAQNAAAASGTTNVAGYFAAGNDITLGELYLALTVFPNTVAANRVSTIQSADGVALRKLGMLASQTYIGINTPSFIAGERLSIEGEVRVRGANVIADGFQGDGSAITAIAQANVTGLAAFILATNTNLPAAAAAAAAAQNTANAGVTNAATAQAAAVAAQGTANTGVANAATAQGAANAAQTQANAGVANALTAQNAANAAQGTANTGVTNAAAALAAANAAQTTANGKANTVHTHNASAIDAGRLEAERITLPTISPTGAATGIQRPQDGWNAYDINFIKISPTQYIPVFTGFNI